MERPDGLFVNGQEKPQETNGTGDETPKDTRSAPSPIPLFLLGATLVGIGCCGGGAVAVHSNDRAAAPVGGAAEAMARERNTCAIESLVTTSKFGRPALSMVVRITPGKMPSSRNEQYDGLGMDVTFEDAPASANLLSGIVVANKTHRGEPYSRMLSGGPEDGPGNAANAVDITTPLLTNDESTYEVFRQNAVEAHVTGPLVADTHLAKEALVSCGTFTYKPGSQPAIH